MVRRTVVLICIAVVAVAPFMVPGPSVAAVGGKIESIPAKESWYNTTPACVSLVDCSTLPPVTPYPEDTLHVATSGGEETAGTYLSFAPALPLGAVIQGGTLTLPVDTEPSHGSASPETARIIACLTTPEFDETRGSFEKPPDADCEVRKSALYSEKRALFEVELSRFAAHWTVGEVALALLPSEQSAEGANTWRVVFPASESDSNASPGPEPSPSPSPGEDARVITATFEYTIAEDEVDPIGSDFEFDTTTGSDSSSTGDFDSSAGPSFGGSFDTGTVETGETVGDLAGDPAEAIGDEGVQEVASFAEGFAGPGFAYPIVWALPLLILAAFAAVGRALTKELYRADD